jgi:hypothetical protein
MLYKIEKEDKHKPLNDYSTWDSTDNYKENWLKYEENEQGKAPKICT